MGDESDEGRGKAVHPSFPCWCGSLHALPEGGEMKTSCPHTGATLPARHVLSLLFTSGLLLTSRQHHLTAHSTHTNTDHPYLITQTRLTLCERHPRSQRARLSCGVSYGCLRPLLNADYYHATRRCVVLQWQ